MGARFVRNLTPKPVTLSTDFRVVYRVPDGRETEVVRMRATDSTGVAPAVTVLKNADNAEGTLIRDAILEPSGFAEFEGSIPLKAGETIIARSNVANVVAFEVDGIEEDT